MARPLARRRAKKENASRRAATNLALRLYNSDGTTAPLYPDPQTSTAWLVGYFGGIASRMPCIVCSCFLKSGVCRRRDSQILSLLASRASPNYQQQAAPRSEPAGQDLPKIAIPCLLSTLRPYMLFIDRFIPLRLAQFRFSSITLVACWISAQSLPENTRSSPYAQPPFS